MKKVFAVSVLVMLVLEACMAKAQNNSYANDALDFVSKGWFVDDEVHDWTFVSADAPSFVISVNADVTEYMSAGLKFRVTQSGVDELFFVTKVGAYTAGSTELTLYGGTDYELADVDITEVAYSRVQSPYGFPLNAEKWTIEVIETNNYSQAATSGTWYNIGGLSIDLKVGSWYVGYYASVEADSSAIGFIYNSVTLSDNASTESNIKMRTGQYSNSSTLIVSDVFIETRITLDINQTYYLLLSGNSATLTVVEINGAQKATILYAICAYL